MKKKILVMVALIFLILPSTGAFALENNTFWYSSNSQGAFTYGYSYHSDKDNAVDGTYFTVAPNNTINDVVWTELNTVKDVSSFSYEFYGGSTSNFVVKFYNSSKQLINGKTVTHDPANKTLPIIANGTKYVEISTTSGVDFDYFDVNVGDDKTPPGNVTGLTATPKDGAVQLNWTNPTDSDFSALNIYRDGQKVVYKLSSEFESRLMSGLTNGETYNFKVTTVDNDGNESSGVTVSVTPNNSDSTAPGEVTNINADPGEETIKFNYTLPTDSDFSHLKIYRDSELIEGSYKTGSFTDEGLSPNTEYQYRFVSVDENGNESNGVTKTVSTFVPLKDISNLKADPDYNRVDLSWKLPQSTEFKHVNIYRDEVAEEPGFFQQLFAGASVSAAEEPTKIFETNGTYFNDLTVAPETTYEYKLTSQSTTGEETDGVTVQATTTEEPAPEMGDSGYTITPEGDYLYKWDSPTEGQVKVNIAGSEYKTVEASEGQIIIPKDQMKYTIFGDPDIRLYPVSPYGKEGEPYDSSKLFKDGMMPFGGQDLLKTGMSLLGVVGPLVLLGLSFLLFPKIRKIIFNSFSKWKERRG